jgi:hypothetical protein
VRSRRIAHADDAERARERRPSCHGIGRLLNDGEGASQRIGRRGVAGALVCGDRPLDRLAERGRIEVVTERRQPPGGDGHERRARVRTQGRARGEDQHAACQRRGERGTRPTHAR